MTHDEMIAVIQAAKAGARIQFRERRGLYSKQEPWQDAGTAGLLWDFNGYDYRVKPEPREVWINSTSEGLGDTHYNSREDCMVFHYGRPVCFREVL